MYETVIGFAHQDPATAALYLTIWTAGNLSISLTPDHFLYRNGSLTLASDVAVDDFLNDGDRVVAIARTLERGLYIPVT